jgi:hypothetical protein
MREAQIRPRPENASDAFMEMRCGRGDRHPAVHDFVTLRRFPAIIEYVSTS